MRAAARLHVYLAQAAPRAVVLRRGPSQWARLSVWQTDSDTFEHGQWIRARVYERRCDVSSDGSLFIAFIGTGATTRHPDQRASSWIVITRPPYFSALALWWVGSTWCTGGLFPAPDRVWVPGKADPDQGQLPKWLGRVDAPPHVDRTNNWTDRTVFHNRLLRAGWERTAHTRFERWEHASPGGHHALVLRELGWDPRAFGGPHMVQYALRDRAGVERDLPGLTWADWDYAGKLLAAQDGRLLRAGPDDDEWRVIQDFNHQLPEPLPPPARVLRWP
jgi:hypothetical protein